MKKIDKYLLKEMFLPVVFGVSLITFALMIDVISSIAETLIVKSVSLLEVLTMFSYLTPQILVQTIPLGVFFGIMMTYNSLSTTSEIVALQSSGMSLNRMLKTPLIIGLVTTFAIYGFQEKIQPLAQKKADALIRKIAYSKPSTQLEPKRFISNVGGAGMSIYVENFSAENIAENLISFKSGGKSPYPELYIAKRAEFTNSEIIINEAKIYTLFSKDISGQNRRDFTLLEGNVEKMVIPVSSFFGDPRQQKISEKSLGIKDLYYSIKEKKATGEEYKKSEVELYTKTLTPLGAVLFALLGPILSIRHSRTVKGLNLGISLGIIFAYMGLNTILYSVAENNQIPLYLLILPNLLLLITTVIAYSIQSRR